MATSPLNGRQQGRSGQIVSPPLEIIDPPSPYSDELLARFPSMKVKQAEFDAWWAKERTQREALIAVVETLIVKVNSTS